MKRIGSAAYSLAIILSCVGMSVSFLDIDIGVNCLRIATMLTLVSFIFSLIRPRIRRKDALAIVLIFFAICCALVKMLYYEQVTSIAPLMFISGMLILGTVILGYCKISYNVYILINIAGALMLIVGIFTNSHSTWGAVQIGYINPQIIGSWALMYSTGALLSFDYFFERVKHRFIFLLGEIIIYGFMIFIAMITESRFALLIMIVALILRMLPVMKIFNSRVMRLVTASFPALFMILSHILMFTGLFDNMEGDSLLNGRETIWLEAMELALRNPLLGASYRTIDANTYYSHNVFVDYCVLFGFLVAVTFVIILSYVMVSKVPIYVKQKEKGKVTERLNYDAFVMFCLCIVGASVEGAFFSVGAGGLYMFTYGLLFIAVSNDKQLLQSK